MTCLAREKLFVEGTEVGGTALGQHLDEELEALAGPRLDERADEEPIDDERQIRRREPVHRTAELGGVVVDGRRAETEPASLEEIDDALEMLELLPRDFRERTHEAEVARVPDDERQRVRRRLHLAVGVIDEDRIEVRYGARRPGRVRRGAKAEHASEGIARPPSRAERR